MVAVSNADLQASLAFVREAMAVDGADPFPTELLDGLRTLVEADAVRYCEQDRVAERNLYFAGCSVSNAVAAQYEDRSDVFWAFRDENPILNHHLRTGDFAACKLSDFLTRRQLRRLTLYNEFFHPADVEHRFVVGLPAPQSHTKAFLVDRADGRDFGERDRTILDLVRPHLEAAYTAARDRRLAAALKLGQPAAAGLVALGLAGRVDWIAPQADLLLTRFCGGRVDGRLPEPIESWLADGASALNIRLDRWSLAVRRVGQMLLLREENTALTPREREILELVAAGRSNSQIASVLWISPGTVRIHLQHIYAKLGVHSRTEAVARLHDADELSVSD